MVKGSFGGDLRFRVIGPAEVDMCGERVDLGSRDGASSVLSPLSVLSGEDGGVCGEFAPGHADPMGFRLCVLS